MFTGGMCEATEGAVDIHQVEPEVFRSLLGFLYTGESRGRGWGMKQFAVVPCLQLVSV